MNPHDDDPVCRDVATRLAAQFGGTLSGRTVTTTVRQAHADLRGQIVPEALGEMLHRLAHHRLNDLCRTARSR
ncbi:hypothetical protein AB0I60_01845 [Actinosynnema sp. NPDC050436]|uniref:three-helix bundle dimerization domain-containing protein n=1 Tax=Actinosynnema sp. NPDC050436 TaxID=3155659 RepID=UPI0034068A30